MTALRVLVVEDDPAFARFVASSLESFPLQRFRARVAGTLADAVRQARKGAYDAVVLDTGLPDSRPRDTVGRFLEQAPALPVVVLTGSLEETEEALAALRTGVQDYLGKGGVTPDTVGRSVLFAMARFEMERARRQRAADQERMLDLAAHEVTTPLAPLLLQMDLLERHLPPEANERARVVRRGLVRLQRGVRDMMEAARAPHDRLGLKVEPVDLARVVRDVAAEFQAAAEAAGLGLEVEAAGPVPCRGDPDRLAQVVINLLSNALKFTPRGGRIRLAAWEEGPRARLVIQDTGPGIAAQDLLRLFKPYSRLPPAAGAAEGGMKGAGLGLYICRRLVEAHGGRVWAEGGEGRGLAVHVEIPAGGARAAEDEAEPVPRPPG